MIFLVPLIAEASSQLEGQQLPGGYISDSFNGGNFGVHQPPHLERNSEGKTYGAVFVIVGKFRLPGFEPWPPSLRIKFTTAYKFKY